MILFLDDDSNRAAIAYKRWPEEKRNNTMWVTTAEDAISVLDDYCKELKEVYLDHDLGGERYVNTKREDCGMEVVRWLESQPDIGRFSHIRFTVHTWNIPAGHEMTGRLNKLGLKVTYTPFGM
jgi:hypothetical protein